MEFKSMRFSIVGLLLLILATGCSIKPRYEAPAPVIKSSTPSAQVVTPPQTRTEGQVKITPLQEPNMPKVATTSTAPAPAQNRAVELLQERAADQVNQGDFASAAKSLERALSIEPNNARTWNLLAHLREKQSQYDIAAEIAARSNSLLTGGQTQLEKDNWLLIARAKAQLGDAAGAAHAKKQAGLLN